MFSSKTFFSLLLLFYSTCIFAAFGDSAEDRQVRIGLKLFRTILAADQHIQAKTNKADELTLILIYVGSAERAQKLARELAVMGRGQKKGKIRGIPATIKISRPGELSALSAPPAGIFIIDPLGSSDLRQIIDYAHQHHRILYSPFSGDVERGVMAGLAIETRVRPYVNQSALKASSIDLKAFFLKVSKIYEP